MYVFGVSIIWPPSVCLKIRAIFWFHTQQEAEYCIACFPYFWYVRVSLIQGLYKCRTFSSLIYNSYIHAVGFELQVRIHFNNRFRCHFLHLLHCRTISSLTSNDWCKMGHLKIAWTFEYLSYFSYFATSSNIFSVCPLEKVHGV